MQSRMQFVPLKTDDVSGQIKVLLAERWRILENDHAYPNFVLPLSTVPFEPFIDWHHLSAHNFYSMLPVFPSFSLSLSLLLSLFISLSLSLLSSNFIRFTFTGRSFTDKTWDLLYIDVCRCVCREFPYYERLRLRILLLSWFKKVIVKKQVVNHRWVY